MTLSPMTAITADSADSPVAHLAVHVRDALPQDIPAIEVIYRQHVLNGTASFEEAPPDVAELQSRYTALKARGLPWFVAEFDGGVVGYAYATPYRPRSAYRFTIENSIYVSAGLGGKGIGSALLQALIERCEQGPWRQMFATVGGSDNAGSLALHRRFGFDMVGTVRSAGFKFGAWVDVVLMQRALGPGGTTLPEEVAPGNKA